MRLTAFILSALASGCAAGQPFAQVGSPEQPAIQVGAASQPAVAAGAVSISASMPVSIQPGAVAFTVTAPLEVRPGAFTVNITGKEGPLVSLAISPVINTPPLDLTWPSIIVAAAIIGAAGLVIAGLWLHAGRADKLAIKRARMYP